MLDALPTISETIAKYGLGAKKSLGQNFILDLNLTQKIARQGLPYSDDELLVEIGPGPGALTRGILLSGAKRLVAIEKDSRCLKALAELSSSSDDRLFVQEGDALVLSVGDLLDQYHASGIKIIANLPYNISTELLMTWVSDAHYINGLVLMFQREVAERICANPQTKSYGRLSVLCQLRFRCKIAFDVPPSAFKPAPKVTSSIVVMKTKETFPEDSLWKAIQDLTKQAFAQRRKMLRKTMKDVMPSIESFLKNHDLLETARAEELSPQMYEKMAKHYLEVHKK